MALESVPCTIKAPVPLQVGDVKTEQASPGVYVIDVTFPKSQTVDLQEITFKNYYTAFLTVRIQQRRPSEARGNTAVWCTCIKNLCLMPNPHMEEGSQDYVSLHKSQMLCNTDNVSTIRLILRQPSPVWLNFTVEDLQINPPGKQSPQKEFSRLLSQLPPKEQLQNLHKRLPEPGKVSSEVQQMWALTEVMKANQSTASIGRFDVDGCYEINLLSYT
ncbi:nicolin-1 [Spea bombifrons]|uniref:nicolin-1 n=1 Tax=Spea bombifrons TaxID=233779 RepID=UPI00234BA5C5|nr:nicolin-1 [Spea bombifrons]XP_053325405.1 nicolin-1 [Spea bombifrons]XP_053325406.1 nicolin-1 [Spea bombifrons]